MTAVQAYETERAGGRPAWDDERTALGDWRGEDLRLAEHLASSLGEVPAQLSALLERPGYFETAALALGLVGKPASGEALRPVGDVVKTMLVAVRPAKTPAWSEPARASARAVLPWSSDADRAAVYGTIRPLLDGGGLSRPEKLMLHGILSEQERLDPDPDVHVARLVAELSTYLWED